MTPRRHQFFSQPSLPKQLTAKRFFAFGFPYIWRDKFSPKAAVDQNRKSKYDSSSKRHRASSIQTPCSTTRNQRPIKPNQGKSSPEHFFRWHAHLSPMKTRILNSKFENQSSRMTCHGSRHGLSPQMSRVKRQKSLGKSEIVTVSRVKTPGAVSMLTEVALLALRAVPTTNLSPAAIRGNPRLSAPIHGMNSPAIKNRNSKIKNSIPPRATSTHRELLGVNSTFNPGPSIHQPFQKAHGRLRKPMEGYRRLRKVGRGVPPSNSIRSREFVIIREIRVSFRQGSLGKAAEYVPAG